MNPVCLVLQVLLRPLSEPRGTFGLLATHDLDVILRLDGVLKAHVDHAVRVLDFVRHLKRLVFLWPVVELKLIILVDLCHRAMSDVELHQVVPYLLLALFVCGLPDHGVEPLVASD